MAATASADAVEWLRKQVDEDLVPSLGIEKLSKSQVSQLSEELDGVVKSFRERPLSVPYKYVCSTPSKSSAARKGES